MDFSKHMVPFPLFSTTVQSVGKERETSSDMEAGSIHERLLRVNTKDYGTYNPAPALPKDLNFLKT
ncbi:hypothetical protein RJ641_013830 [Dillenia turbinata]|uniref:Uncharacterized protein n=1 Tax=Dillenia turbinata TaxID=194707 RepID=A0AAN8WE64_9MAGN